MLGLHRHARPRPDRADGPRSDGRGHPRSGPCRRWSGLIDSSYGVLQFLTAPLLGRLADRYGRRPVLLTSLGFLGVDYLAHAVNPTIASLMVFHGLAGAFAGTGTVVNAYVADVTPPAGRPRAYGLVGAAFGVGFVAGPPWAGFSVRWTCGCRSSWRRSWPSRMSRTAC
jgi:DHA1 family tetracycline resistance protein-like MFS transporter